MTVTLPAVRPPTTDTEERLLDHSLTLFAEKGYEAASVREIIDATGVTRAANVANGAAFGPEESVIHGCCKLSQDNASVSDAASLKKLSRKGN